MFAQEGSLDSQSLFGRLGWLEQTANPSPRSAVKVIQHLRAKWVGNGKFSPVSTQGSVEESVLDA